jgi:hypothetical protein
MMQVASRDNLNPFGSTHHDDKACSNNTAHVPDFMVIDHDKLALAFFASLRYYSFPIASREREDVFVTRMMDQERTVDIKEDWMRHSNEADTLRAGRGSLRVFGIQHMFAATKGRVATKVVEATERNDLMLLSAKGRV